jgi:hypothetical protein
LLNFLTALVADHLLKHVVLHEEVALLIYEFANFLKAGDCHKEVTVLDRVLKVLLEVRPDLFAKGASVERNFTDGNRDKLEVGLVLAPGEVVLLFLIGGGLFYLLLHFVT